MNTKNENKSVTFLISDVNKLFHNRIKSECERRGLNSTYIKILMLLSLKGEVNQTDIVNYTYCKKPTISLTLQKMESEGYIERNNSENDLRSVKVKLTTKGIELDKKLRDVFFEEDKKINSLFNDEEFNLLKTYILRIIESMEENK